MNIAIIGQGGHSKVITDLLSLSKKHSIIGYFDDRHIDLTVKDNTFFGPVIMVKKLLDYFKDIKVIIAIGDNKIRKKIVERLGFSEESYITLIHPSAIISPSAKIGTGTVIMAYSVVQADTEIGRHSIINTSTVIEHDNVIGDFVHVSPNVTLTGAVQIEEGVHIGAGASIIPNLSIGEWSVIGAGATVINCIPSFCTAVGVPAKVKLKKTSGGV
ncbi:acetyltransferase [Bacillus sp. 1NLA3E]|jgi:acetyltransferase EpsM|uniref:acetyltransferase n=1 Tax=Bacillus sp. 1NLA3E TaxID=666686 RepID=UPI000247E8B1|nr:acetyltransferase [Bacillus sp. 1NLA3E]AGK52655.1 hypothetical protein B1NLA3E_04405 [Bacillus sp. 1NLA3E]